MRLRGGSRNRSTLPPLSAPVRTLPWTVFGIQYDTMAAKGREDERCSGEVISAEQGGFAGLTPTWICAQRPQYQ